MQAKSTSEMVEHKEWLDWLRGIAAVAVALYHFCQARDRPNGMYESLMGYGYLGVTVFFVVSGFCIFVAAEKSSGWGSFLARRVFRIYPPYLCSLLLIAVIIGFRMFWIGSNDVVPLPKTASEILLTLTAMVYPFTSVHALNWVYWTLVYEIAFYFAVAVCLVNRNFFKIAIFFITFASIFANSEIGKSVFFLDQWPLFSLGISVALLRTGISPFSIAFFATTIIAASQIEFEDGKANAIITVGYATTIFFFIMLFVEKKYRIPDLKILGWLGKISYSLYLIHVPVGIYLIRDFEAFGIDLISNPDLVPLIDLIKLLICIAVSFLAYKFVELPSIALGRRISQVLKK